MARAAELIDGLQAEAVLGDKGYDADHLHEKIASQGGDVDTSYS